MKVKLKCIFGNKNPDDIVELKDEIAMKLILENNATEVKAEDEVLSAKTLKLELTKMDNENTSLKKSVATKDSEIAELKKAATEKDAKIAELEKPAAKK